jgi:flagellum-specific peptidoglycan hydrolase FlgJ
VLEVDPAAGDAGQDDAALKARNNTRRFTALAIVIGAAILIALLARPAVEGTKMITKAVMEKLKLKDLLAKFGKQPIASIPADLQPAAYRSAVPWMTAVQQQYFSTTPIEKVFGLSSWYDAPPDTAMANQAKAIANDSTEFVRSVKSAAIAAAAAGGLKNPKNIVAQAALESGWGKKAIGGTNLFGHVATQDWANSGGKFSFETTSEYVDGKKIPAVRPFRVYDSLQQAFTGHIKVLSTYPGALDADTPQKFGAALVDGKKKYATDPAYKSLIEQVYKKVDSLWG